MKTPGQNQPGKRMVDPNKASLAGGKQVRGKEQRKAGEIFRDEVAEEMEQEDKATEQDPVAGHPNGDRHRH